MTRRTDDQLRTALQERIAKLQQQVRRIDKRAANQARRERNHRLIVGGTLAETHVLQNPRSEYARLHVELIRQYARPEDRHLFADLFRAVLPAGEAARLLGEAPAANSAEFGSRSGGMNPAPCTGFIPPLRPLPARNDQPSKIAGRAARGQG